MQGGMAALTIDTAQGGRVLSGGLWREFRSPGKCFRGLMANRSLLLGCGFPCSVLIPESFYIWDCTGDFLHNLCSSEGR